ncbi:GDNF family receptor alpha-like [Trichinella papuae]|uniref:GDNF family receptor alpha-like n=1 Tax=Trichinella papuae TaxID=268474 RepID=A0A0V1MQ50_9BILA|nr:GDNF family receptor alpha-like [Trichinella papuae]
MTQLGTFEQSKSMRNFMNSNFVNNRINDDQYPAFILSHKLTHSWLKSFTLAYKLYANFIFVHQLKSSIHHNQQQRLKAMLIFWLFQELLCKILSATASNCANAVYQCRENEFCSRALENHIAGRKKTTSSNADQCRRAIRALRQSDPFHYPCSCSPMDIRCMAISRSIFNHPCYRIWEQLNKHKVRHLRHKLKLSRSDQNWHQINEPNLLNQTMPICTTALYWCLKNSSCRQIWRTFLQMCPMEKFECRMSDKQKCRDAYMALKRTPLYRCSCLDQHREHGPECHLIELIISHNKCIEEVENAKFVEKAISNDNEMNPIREEILKVPSAVTYLKKLSDGTILEVTETDPDFDDGNERQTTYFLKMTENEQKPNNQPTDRAEVDAEILDNNRTAKGYIVFLPWIRSTKFVSDNEVQASSGVIYRIDSTCNISYEECARDRICNWHLSEIKLYCHNNSPCERELCVPTLRRFSRYVNYELQQLMLFCSCRASDIHCRQQQRLLLPVCAMQVPMDQAMECQQLVDQCFTDPVCRFGLIAFIFAFSKPLQMFHRIWGKRYFKACRWDQKKRQCRTNNQAAACRQALIKIRGSALESDCYCMSDDRNCREIQESLPFRNPCFEEIRLSMIPNFHLITSQNGRSRTNSSKYKMPTTLVPSTAFSQLPYIKITVMQATSKSKNDSQEENTAITYRPYLFTTTSQAVTEEIISVTTTSNDQHSDASFTQSLSTNLATTTPSPKEDECIYMDKYGKQIFWPMSKLFRNYTHPTRPCSAYCECGMDHQPICHEIGCLQETPCQGAVISHSFGSPMWLPDRGLCSCFNGDFICERPKRHEVEFSRGLYFLIGYADEEVRWIAEHLPQSIQHRYGFDQPNTFYYVLIDLLQQEFRLHGDHEELRCRFFHLFSSQGNVILQVERFYGAKFENETTAAPSWVTGGPEKACKRPLRLLKKQIKDGIFQNDLVLSVIKQATIQDNLPASAGTPLLKSYYANIICTVVALLLSI